MAKSLEEILDKGLARIAKLDKQKANVKEGKGLGLTTALNDLERSERALVKGREAYIKSIMINRDNCLSVDLNMEAINDGRKIAEKAANQVADILRSNWKRKTLLRLDLLIAEVKEAVANIDIDNIIDASQSYDDFVEGLNEYTLAILSTTSKFEHDKVKHLWKICMPEKHVNVLSRTSTPYDAIDRFRIDAVRGINSAETEEAAREFVAQFIKEANIWFETRGVGYQIQ